MSSAAGDAATAERERALWRQSLSVLKHRLEARAASGSFPRADPSMLSPLSMPLGDAAIFFGKFAAAVLYGWAFTVLASLVAAGAVNVLHPDAAPIFYAPEAFLGILAFGLLVTALLVSAGTLLSLRSPTVRQASQTVSVLVLALVLIPAGLSQIAPTAWVEAILDGVDRFGPVAAGVVVMVLLAAIDAVIVFAGVRRFKRADLVAG